MKKVLTVEAVKESAARAREKLAAGNEHGGLCGLIWARKDADRVAEKAIMRKDYPTALVAVQLAGELHAEYEVRDGVRV